MASTPGNPNPNQGQMFPRGNVAGDQVVEVKANVDFSGSNNQVVKDFQKSIDQLGLYINDFKNVFSSYGQAQGAGKMIAPKSGGNGPSPGASTPPAGPGVPIPPEQMPTPDPDQWGTMGYHNAGMAGAPPGISKTEKLRRQTIDQRIHSSGVSAGASIPPGKEASMNSKRDSIISEMSVGTGDQAWYGLANNSQRDLSSPVRLPSYGEVQLDQKLMYGSDFLLRRAMTNKSKANIASDNGDTDEADRLNSRADLLGNMGGRVQGAAEVAAPLVAGYRDLRKIGSKTGMVSPEQAGIAAGYDRGSTVSIGPFGRMLPNFGSNGATAEGLRQNITGLRIGAQGGLSVKQGNDIVQALAGEGFTGDQSTTMAMNYIAPLVKQGQDPSATTSMFTRGIRNGNTSMDEMATALDNMGRSAREARQDLSDYTQGIDSFASTLQAGGATYGSAVQGARTLTSSFGMTPQQTEQITSSPMVTNAALMNAGGSLLPQQVAGAMSSNPVFASQAIIRASNMAKTMGRNLPIPTDAKTGKPLMSREEAQDEFAAQQMGVDTETYKNLLARAKSAPIAADLGSKITDADNNYKGVTARLGNLVQKDSDGNMKTSGGHVQLNSRQMSTMKKEISSGRYADGGDGSTSLPQSIGNKIFGGLFGGSGDEKKIDPATLQKMKDQYQYAQQADSKYNMLGHQGSESYDAVEAEMSKLAPKKGTPEYSNWQSRLNDINKMSDNPNKGKALQDLVNERMGVQSQQDANTATIELSDDAYKLFRLSGGSDKTKRAKNEGKDVGVIVAPAQPTYNSGIGTAVNGG